jgi:[ribosomal protein S5]-alanine N-acetyltransferase
MNRPPFVLFPELMSSRILLRRLESSDAAFVLDIMVYNGKPAESIADAVAMIERIENDSQNGDTVNWVLIHRETNAAMGTIGYYRGFANETGEIGFVMKPEYHGKGYMTDALNLVTEFGWNTLQLKRIIAITKLLNEPAVHLLERCGFRYKCPFDDVYSEFEHVKDQI